MKTSQTLIFLVMISALFLQACGPATVSAIQTAYAGTIIAQVQQTLDPTTRAEQAIAVQTEAAAGCPNSASIGDFVWFDANGNDNQDVGELGAPGIIVELQSISGGYRDTTVTDSSGHYNFCVPQLPSIYMDGFNRGERVPPRVNLWFDYKLYFNAPDGYTFTQYHDGYANGFDSNVTGGVGGSTNWFYVYYDTDTIDAGLVLLDPSQANSGATETAIQSASAFLTVTDDVNCRMGPGTQYSVVETLGGGDQVPVVAVLPNSEYVVVELPDGRECWLWTRYADKADFSGLGLPEATQPPTPTPYPTETPKPTKTPSPTPTPTPTQYIG